MISDEMSNKKSHRISSIRDLTQTDSTKIGEKSPVCEEGFTQPWDIVGVDTYNAMFERAQQRRAYRSAMNLSVSCVEHNVSKTFYLETGEEKRFCWD